ncbi:MAG: hypothetical protein NWF11_01380 [Candidatus Bathyarchaeota archaeon]|nr:hypothetical protein [Candidatus Bathyarchaeota archaeon]
MRRKLSNLLRRFVVWVDLDLDELEELDIEDEIRERMLTEGMKNAARKGTNQLT